LRQAEREKRLDYRCAQITWITAELNRDKAKRAQPYRVSDFMLSSGREEEKKPDWRGMLEQVRMLNAVYGGAVVPSAPAEERPV